MRDRQAPAWLTEWEYAHRGRHGAGVPENSLQAARLAIAAGMGIECDIQRSADDHPMVFHDWDLKRLIGRSETTESLTKDALEGLHYLGSDERIASLADLLGLVAGQVPILIEIKSKRGYDVARSCAAVRDALVPYGGDHAVMSFDPRVARWFRRNSPHTTAGLVMREDEHGSTRKAWQRQLALAIAKPDFLAYHIAALPSPWVARLRAKGLPILTWTVNSTLMRLQGLSHADALIVEGAGLA
ncbi:MAG: glycerophosphodiester phosphodiesterase family protein [Erythrobacter sp.]